MKLPIGDKNIRRQFIHTKLKSADVIKIHKLCHEGLTLVAIANQFGISTTHVRRIRDKQLWKTVLGKS